MNYEQTLVRLCALSGPSGFEERAAEAAAQKLQELTQRPKTAEKKPASDTKAESDVKAGAKRGRKKAADTKTAVKPSAKRTASKKSAAGKNEAGKTDGQ